MKARAVVEMNKVGDFVGNDRAAHEIGGHDQAPVDPDRAICRTAAPAPLRAGQGHARHRLVCAEAIVREILLQTVRAPGLPASA